MSSNHKPPCAPPFVGHGGGARRNSRLGRLEAELREAKARAKAAETALAAATRVDGQVSKEVVRLRAALKRRLLPLRKQVLRRMALQRELAYARARIELLEEENAKLKGSR